MASRLANIAPFGSLLIKAPRERNERYLDLVRLLPCIICGRRPCDAAHVRMGDMTYGKRPTGIGEKASDKWTLPLCEEHHLWGPHAQHSRGERQWWEEHGINPVQACHELQQAFPKHGWMLAVINKYRT